MDAQRNTSRHAALASTPQSKLALGLSVLYEALAIALEDPSRKGMARLCDADATLALMDAAGYVDELLAPGQRLAGEGNIVADSELAAKTLALPLASMLGSVTEDEDALLVDVYQRLFGHGARGQVSPYETEYGADAYSRPAQELSDIHDFYEAYGFKTNVASHQRCDHISVECEFAAYLARKKAYYLEKYDWDSAAAVYRARWLFLQDNLGRFGRAFAVSLMKAADHPFYRGAAEFCEILLATDCRHLGVELGSRLISLRSTEDDGVPVACDMRNLHKSLGI